ncbi:MAG: PAS domain S-box protein [Actinomycetota bacterium]|nr:PAS domain S-box protein [Actinomycetota bacterium]
MTLSTQRLPPEPTSAGRARRLVADALVTSGHEDLVEAATLLVSEVVTNAVLHAGTDIVLRCRTSADLVRVEVADSSPVRPGLRNYDEEATTGRGLELVDLLASAWGVDPRRDGKTLWFELGSVVDQGGSGAAAPLPGEAAADVPGYRVQLLSLPVALVGATVQSGDALLRERALLALGDEPTVTVPADWRTPGLDLTPILAALEDAAADGKATIDLEVAFPEGSGPAALERLALVDEAERLAAAGLLLSPPSLPEVGLCRRWLLGQIALQAEGGEPEPWELPPPLEPARDAATLSPTECARLAAIPGGVVVADDANRIIYVNAAAAELLGWDEGDLAGRRLTTIIPPQLREAHLAGYTRYQLTGEARLMGRSVRVPALRRDGSSVEVDLTIDQLPSAGGRTAFRAGLRPA